MSLLPLLLFQVYSVFPASEWWSCWLGGTVLILYVCVQSFCWVRGMCGSLSDCFYKVVKCTTLHLRCCETNRRGCLGLSLEITHSGCRALVKLKGSVGGAFVLFVTSAVILQLAAHSPSIGFSNSFEPRSCCQEFWYMTQPFTQNTVRILCCLNVSPLAKDWGKMESKPPDIDSDSQ